MNILVLDGNQNQAVASVRSLARAGHTVFAGEAAPWSKASWSRACSGAFQYPSPQKSVDAFIAAIAAFVHKNPGTLLLPMTELTTLPLSAQRDLLTSAGAQLILPDHANLLRAFNKAETTRLAESLGVAVPKTILVTSSEQAASAAQQVRFPVVLKPQTSEEISPDGSLRTAGRPRYARDSAECVAAFDDIRSRSSAVLIQEFVEGEGTGYFALMHHGEVRAEFAHRRIRDVHPTGSGSAVRESTPVDPEIRRCSLAILAALNWHGVAMVEYRKKPGSAPVFMEVNGRFWHSLPLACYAGVDFPRLLVEMAERGDVEPNREYHSGVRCRWFLGDARHLAEVWKGPPRGYPGRYPSRLGTLLQVLTPVPGTYHDLFQWRDPLPEAADWINFFLTLLRRHSAS
ncbi:MAG: ATP-grasp domain-containing protein [Candidatus Acidiferrales bacterium]